MSQLTDVRQEPSQGGKPEQLVVFLHGIGVDGNDLIGLAPFYAKILPGARFLAPHGLQKFDMAPTGRQWFSLNDISEDTLDKGVKHAADAVNAYIDDALAESGLSEDKLAIVGFSQGTMTALYLAFRRPRPIAALVGYSGALIAPEKLYHEIVSRPPTLLVHGAEDEVVPPQNLTVAAEALRALKVPVASHISPGLGHSIDNEGLSLGVQFVGKYLKG